MPVADLLYVADRGRAPYGTRELREVQDISHEVVTWLLDRGATTVVVACNTASAAALDSLRQEFAGIPIVGMEPAVKPAVPATGTGIVAVFATAATFQGRLFDSLVSRYAEGVEIVRLACPEWVAMVEQGLFDGPEVETRVGQALGAGADTLVLGCTHFSFLEPAIRLVAGQAATVIDPAPAIGAQTRRVARGEPGTGKLTLAASGDAAAFGRLARLAGIGEVTGSVLPFGP